MKVKVKWENIRKCVNRYFDANPLILGSDIVELEAELFEQKKQLTNLEKWLEVFKAESYPAYIREYSSVFAVYLDSKGVSADEAFEKIINNKQGEK